MKTSLLVFAAIVSIPLLVMAAEPNTNQVRKIAPRHLRVVTNAPVPPKPAVAKPITLGPRYDVNIAPGTAVIITYTNTFTKQQAQQWLREAIRTLR